MSEDLPEASCVVTQKPDGTLVGKGQLVDGKLPERVKVESVFLEKHGIQLLGTATRGENGKYTCLANTGCALVLLEISIWIESED